MTTLRRSARIAGLVALAACLVLPLVALAQTGDPAIDAILQYVPVKFWPVILAGWAGLFYVVCPLVLRYVKVTPESGNAARWAVKAAEYITQNTHRPPSLRVVPDPKAAEAPKGFISGWVALAVAAVCAIGMLLPVRAFPQDSPKFGGCLSAHPGTCFAPSVSVNLVSIRISDGAVTSTFDPGLGYGVSFFSDKWYTTGVALTAAIPTLDGARRVQPALTGSFAQYARIGYACPLYTPGGCGKNGQITFGFGSDFGAAAK